MHLIPKAMATKERGYEVKSPQFTNLGLFMSNQTSKWKYVLEDEMYGKCMGKQEAQPL